MRKIIDPLTAKLIQTLIRRIPPKKSSPHLDDLVRLLMESLKQGEIYLSLLKHQPEDELKGKGWPSKHRENLLESGWLDGNSSPMVLLDDQLTWRRWHEEMQNILDDLFNRSSKKPDTTLSLQQDLKEHNYSKLNSKQLLAIKAISKYKLVLINGGPGTGKTNTVVQMIIKALSLNRDISIGIGAPTGKAARRIEDTIHKSAISIDNIYKDKLLSIPCLTIHSWLQPTKGRFLKCKSNQLQLDLLIIDEMSMVDLTLMKGLMSALPQETQLVLVGDPDQLPPVGSGSLWHKLHERDTYKKYEHCSIHLKKVYRNRGSIASLATTIRDNGLKAFFSEICNLPEKSNVNILKTNKETLPDPIIKNIRAHQSKLLKLIEKAKPYLLFEKFDPRNTNTIKTINSLLNCLEELIVLCPKRYGLWGIEHVNRTFLGTKFEGGVSGWPEGTPIICGQNQSEINLSNGDIGIIVGEEEKQRLLFRCNSDTNSQNINLVHPSRLKKLDPAFAITIHKAQGSESNNIICLWPDQIVKDCKINSGRQDNTQEEDYQKRLLYTAITRAKEKFDLAISTNEKTVTK